MADLAVASGVKAERERCLAITRAAISAAAKDGRDLVVRTDIIRKIENGRPV